MIGRNPGRPPLGTWYGRRHETVGQIVSQLSRAQGGRGTVQTAGGPQNFPVPMGLIVCYAQPNVSIGAATGSWPDITPGTGTGDAYQGVSGNPVRVGNGATLFNWGPSPTTAGYRLILSSNGDGTFDILGQWCTQP
jgi:hypothetical protein